MATKLIQISGKPDAASVNSVHLNFNSAVANPIITGITNPADLGAVGFGGCARACSVTGAAGWDGGDVTLNGLDIRGNAVSELFKVVDIAGFTKPGVQVFAKVLSITHSLVGAGVLLASVGVGDKLGFAQGGPCFGPAVIFVTGVGELPAALDHTYQSVTPTSVPNAAKTYLLLIGE